MVSARFFSTMDLKSRFFLASQNVGKVLAVYNKLNLTYALIYLDDVIVFSWTEEEHLCQLQAVFKCCREHRLKLKPSKCHFL